VAAKGRFDTEADAPQHGSMLSARVRASRDSGVWPDGEGLRPVRSGGRRASRGANRAVAALQSASSNLTGSPPLALEELGQQFPIAWPGVLELAVQGSCRFELIRFQQRRGLDSLVARRPHNPKGQEVQISSPATTSNPQMLVQILGVF